MLVIIPVVISIIGSKLIVSSWQTQKEKSEIKKSILHEFDQTHPKYGQFMFQMFYKIRYSYIDFSKVKHDERATYDLVKFPSETKEQPLARFGHMLEVLNQAQWEFNTNNTKFNSTIMIYFDNTEDFFNVFDKCDKLAVSQYALLHEIIYTTDDSKFKNLCEKFLEIKDEHKQKMSVIKIMIIYEKIKNTDKGMSKKFIKGFSRKTRTRQE